jgi:hypothetical protein
LVDIYKQNTPKPKTSLFTRKQTNGEKIKLEGGIKKKDLVEVCSKTRKKEVHCLHQNTQKK